MGNGRRKFKLSYAELKKLREPTGNFFTINKIKKKWTDSKTGEVQYLVSWMGYPKSYDTWEPPTSFASCMEVVTEFEEKRSVRLAKYRANKKAERSEIPQIPSKPVQQSQNSFPTIGPMLIIKAEKDDSSRLNVPFSEQTCVDRFDKITNPFTENLLAVKVENDKQAFGTTNSNNEIETYVNQSSADLAAASAPHSSGTNGCNLLNRRSLNVPFSEHTCVDRFDKSTNPFMGNLLAVKVENDKRATKSNNEIETYVNQSSADLAAASALHSSGTNGCNLLNRQLQETHFKNNKDAKDPPPSLLAAVSHNPRSWNMDMESDMPSLGQPYYPELQKRIRILSCLEITEKFLENQKPIMIGALNANMKLYLIAAWTVEQTWSCFGLDLATELYPSLTAEFLCDVPRYYVSMYRSCGPLQKNRCRFWGHHFDFDKIFTVSLNSTRLYYLLQPACEDMQQL